jgi:hypothetical protein
MQLIPGQSERSTKNNVQREWQESLQSCDNNASTIPSFSTNCSFSPRTPKIPAFARFQTAETLPFATEVIIPRQPGYFHEDVPTNTPLAARSASFFFSFARSNAISSAA